MHDRVGNPQGAARRAGAEEVHAGQSPARRQTMSAEEETMPTSPTAQTTEFTRDVLGRYICNGLDEALRSTDKGAFRPDGSPQSDARPFDVIVIGGGSF